MWKDIPGFEGFYQANELGYIRSLPRATTSGGLLPPHPDPRGRLYVHLSKEGKASVLQVSAVVALTFLGPRLGRVVRHLDDDKSNNKVGNLAYGTTQDNADDAVRNGRTLRGEKHHKAKMNEAQVIDARLRMEAGQDYKEVAALYGVKKETMQGIKHRRIWKWLN